MLGLCIAGTGTAASDDDAVLERIATVEYDWTALRALEPGALDRAGTRARREDARLILFPDRGPAITLKDELEKCDDPGWSEETCHQFRFAGYFQSRRAFIVHVGYFEGSDWLLIDADSGHQAKLRSLPIFEPGGDRLLMIDNAVPLDTSRAPGAQLWSRMAGRTTLEWDYVVDWHLPHEIRLRRWQGDRIEFEFFTPAEYRGREEQVWPAVLNRVQGAWVLEAARPAKSP